MQSRDNVGNENGKEVTVQEAWQRRLLQNCLNLLGKGKEEQQRLTPGFQPEWLREGCAAFIRSSREGKV